MKIARMRAAQKKAQDQQGALDALRAKRAAEENERRARQRLEVVWIEGFFNYFLVICVAFDTNFEVWVINCPSNTLLTSP